MPYRFGFRVNGRPKKNELGTSEDSESYTSKEILLLIMGRTKIPYNQLFYLSRKELDVIVKGHEIDQKEMWEMFRTHASVGIQPHLKKGTSISPDKLMPLPWDKKSSARVVSQESMDKAKKLGEIVRQNRIKKKKDGGSKN
jgi:hypothetical protein